MANKSVIVTVNPRPAIKLMPSTNFVDVGSPWYMTNQTTGGTPPFTYHYNFNTTAGLYVNGNRFTFSAMGQEYQINEVIMDSLGKQAGSGNVLLKAVGSPAVTLIPISNTTIKAGGTVKLITQVSNGTPPFLYTVAIDNSNDTSIYNVIVNSNENMTFNKPGTYSLSETIQDLTGFTMQSSQIPITVLPSQILTSEYKNTSTSNCYDIQNLSQEQSAQMDIGGKQLTLTVINSSYVSSIKEVGLSICGAAAVPPTTTVTSITTIATTTVLRAI